MTRAQILMEVVDKDKKNLDTFERFIKDFIGQPKSEPITFWRDGKLFISLEHEYSYLVGDYYGEHRGGYPWIAPEVEKKAGKLGLFIDWVNPGVLSVTVE